MSEAVLPLRLGSKVRFADRWAGRVTGFEVDEAWEILNLLVTGGILRPVTVKLPFDAASWSADEVVFAEATSVQAFARDVPPVAAPARPISGDTPVSVPGTRLSGALVEERSRRAAELLLKRGGRTYRVPLDQVSLSGKEILVRAQTDALIPYYSDEELTERVKDAVARSRTIPQDEFHSLEISVESGVPRLRGNVRTKRTVEDLRAVLSQVPEVRGAVVEVADDVSLEFEVAQALYQAGVSRGAEIYPRSALGEVSLFGYAVSAEAAQEAVRVASRVPGLRAVRDRLEIGQRQAAAT